jgi:hypothetical protein
VGLSLDRGSTPRISTIIVYILLFRAHVKVVMLYAVLMLLIKKLNHAEHVIIVGVKENHALLLMILIQLARFFM